MVLSDECLLSDALSNFSHTNLAIKQFSWSRKFSALTLFFRTLKDIYCYFYKAKLIIWSPDVNALHENRHIDKDSRVRQDDFGYL